MAQYSNLTPAEGEKMWKELEEYATPFTAVLIYGNTPVLGFLKSALAADGKYRRTCRSSPSATRRCWLRTM